MKRILILFIVFLFLSATVFADMLCLFQGDVNFAQRVFQMQISFKEKESVNALLKLLSNDNYYFNADIKHLKISNIDVSTKLESSGQVQKNDKGNIKSLKGWFWSNYSLVNRKPSLEMSGAFLLDKKSNRLFINSFVWGNIGVSGSIDLSAPHNLDLVFTITDMDAQELFPLLGIPAEDLALEGLVNGKLKVEGLMSSPQIKGQIRASNGSINEMRYNDIFLNLEGSYPWLKIVDSGIIEEDSVPYNLEGRLDLRELGNLNSSAHSIKIAPATERGFNWQSWKIRRRQKNGRDDSVEFRYKLKSDRPFGIRFENDQEILGLEHKIKF